MKPRLLFIPFLIQKKKTAFYALNVQIQLFLLGFKKNKVYLYGKDEEN